MRNETNEILSPTIMFPVGFLSKWNQNFNYQHLDSKYFSAGRRYNIAWLHELPDRGRTVWKQNRKVKRLLIYSRLRFLTSTTYNLETKEKYTGRHIYNVKIHQH